MKEISVSTPLGRCAGKLWGPDSGKKILALHGWLDNCATFDRLAPLLPEYQIAAMDLIGHGLSDSIPPGFNYHFLEGVPNSITILNELGWNECFVMGHSLGASMLSLMAPLQEARVKKAVFIEALGPLSSPADELPHRVGDFIVEKERLKEKRMPVYRDLEAAAYIRFKFGGLTLESCRILCERGVKPVEGGVTWRTDPRLRLPTLHRLTEDEVLAFLKRIPCPTLLIQGKEGPLEQLPGFEARKKAVPNLKVEELSGRHHLHLDSPKPVAKAILKFLKD
jgi:pimeloyl-ACP methyl ester carboxylesterase